MEERLKNMKRYEIVSPIMMCETPRIREYFINSETIDKLNELAEKEEDLSKETEEGKKTQEELKEEQEEINKEFDKIKEDMKELGEKNEELQNPTFSKSSKPKVNPNFTKIKQLIQKNKTEQAIDIMLETWSDDEAIPVLSARFHGVKRENRIGILSHSQYQLASNQINHSLLSILQDIENETL